MGTQDPDADRRRDHDRSSSAHFDPLSALERLPGAEGARFARLFARGTLKIEIYAPRGHDAQQPHARDELYFVIQGSGTFFDGACRRLFGPGDLLFVAAGVEHRFEAFSDDLAVWVIFYGPEGGEKA